MSFQTFSIITAVIYLFYYLIIYLSELLKMGKNSSVNGNVKVEYAVQEERHEPIKMGIQPQHPENDDEKKKLME